MRTNRVVLLALGVLLLAAALGGGHAVDAGLTRTWPEAGRFAWVVGLIASGFGGVFLCLAGLGVVTDEKLARRYEGEQRSLRTGSFFAVYAGTLLLTAAGAAAAERWHGLPYENGLLVVLGAIFSLAATGQPWWLYGTIRRAGWFAGIESDIAMRLLLAVIGLGAIAAGLLSKPT